MGALPLDPTMLMVEQQQREGAARRSAMLRQARRARCATVGCHPLAERAARFLVALGIRYHAWAAPASRTMTATTSHSR